MDAWFLYAEDDGVNHMHILSFIFLEGPPPEYEELVELIRGKLPLLPRYRQVVRTMPLHAGRPIWVDDADFDLEYHVRQTALPHPGDELALERLVSRVMSQRLDRSRPLWELWSVEGLADGRWVLISKLHHAMVDGVSGADMISIMLDKARRPPKPDPVPWTPAPAPTELELIGDAAEGIVRSPVRVVRGALSAARGPIAAAETAVAGIRPRSTRGPRRQRIDAQRPDRPEPALRMDLVLAR